MWNSGQGERKDACSTSSLFWREANGELAETETLDDWDRTPTHLGSEIIIGPVDKALQLEKKLSVSRVLIEQFDVAVTSRPTAKRVRYANRRWDSGKEKECLSSVFACRQRLR